MQVRSYVLGLVAVAYAAFLGVIAVNLAIDPEFVFGTGFFGVTSNYNERNQQWNDFAAAPGTFDGLLLGSSRARVISAEELSQHMGGVTFARFSVSFGRITDFIAMLEFVLRKKAATGSRLRTVFLLLDVDELGRANPDANAIQWMPPPALSGQSTFGFWWTNLTAIQPKAWQFTLRQSRGGSGAGQAITPPNGAEDSGKPLAATAAAPPDEVPAPAADGVPVGEAQPPGSSLTPFHPGADQQLHRITTERDYMRQLKMLERLVGLCRENNVQLVVATPPLSHARAAELDLRDFAKALEDVTRIVPLWDFSISDWPPDSPEFWDDSVHFRPELGHLMLRRIFGDQLPPPWRNFGMPKPPGASLVPAGAAAAR
jgi:hypothetical protein